MDPAPDAVPDPDACDLEYESNVRQGDYEKQAQPVNAEIFAITEEQSYTVARETMREAIDHKRNEGILDLRRVAGLVMICLSHHYFGFPRRPGPNMIRDFTFVARYIFSSPGPTEFLERRAREWGKQEYGKILEFVERHRTKPYDRVGLLSEKLFAMTQQFPDNDEGNQHLARTIAGLCNGMIAPTLGSFLSMMAQLIQSGRLWRVQQLLLLKTQQRDSYSSIATIILPVILESLYSGPVPNIVHRKTTREISYWPWTVEDGKLVDTDPPPRQLEPGTRVILGIESATCEMAPPTTIDAAGLIFGGTYGPSGSTGTHACSGARMGIGILAGMLTALLESGNLKLENEPLTLSRNVKEEHAIP
jgi:hypothetical protein